MSFEMTLEGIAAFLGKGGTARQVVLETYRQLKPARSGGLDFAAPARDVLAEAALLDKSDGPRKLLHAVAFAIKDNIDLAGLPTTAACPDFAWHTTSRRHRRGAARQGRGPSPSAKPTLTSSQQGSLARSPHGAPLCIRYRLYFRRVRAQARP